MAQARQGGCPIGPCGTFFGYEYGTLPIQLNMKSRNPGSLDIFVFAAAGWRVWPAASSLECLFDPDYNLVTSDLQPMVSSMDSTLFRDDKRGWDQCEATMWRAQASGQVSYAWMHTSGGYRGFLAFCRSCQRVCGVERPKWTTEATTAEMRNRWLNFHDVPSPSSTDPPVR